MLDELRRDMARLAWVREQINAIEQARLERLAQAPSTGPHAMVRMLASIVGVGVETADMLVQEILSRMRKEMVSLIGQRDALGGREECPNIAERLRENYRPIRKVLGKQSQFSHLGGARQAPES